MIGSIESYKTLKSLYTTKLLDIDNQYFVNELFFESRL
jgi:hypothetical protein